MEEFLHKRAVFSCSYSLLDSIQAPLRVENLERTWGIVFLVHDLKLVKAEVERLWKFAADKGKRVYLCMIKGNANDVTKDGTLFI